MPIVDFYRRALRIFRASHARTTLLRTSAASLLLLALLTAGVVAQDAMGSPQPPAPRFFVVTDVGVDDVELTHVEPAEDGMTRVTVYRPRVADIQVYDASGAILGGEAFLAGVDVGTVVLVAADENPVDPVYLSILRDDAFVLVGVVVRVETEQSLRPGRERPDHVHGAGAVAAVVVAKCTVDGAISGGRHGGAEGVVRGCVIAGELDGSIAAIHPSTLAKLRRALRIPYSRVAR